MWDVGMTQVGSGVAGLSSSGIGFNHSGLGVFFGRCAEPVSYELDIFVVPCIDDCGAGSCDDPEAPVSCHFFLLRSESGGGERGS
ncbi:hypothetical protein Tco_0717950 [Tanacetum coccineum]